MSRKQHSTPNLFSEMFMSMFKTFSLILLAIIILNNVVWAFYALKPTTPPRIGDTRVEINQSGNHDIKQNINN